MAVPKGVFVANGRTASGEAGFGGKRLELFRFATAGKRSKTTALCAPLFYRPEKFPKSGRCEKQLVIVPGATHLFKEPGTLEAVVEHAHGWFLTRFKEVQP